MKVLSLPRRRVHPMRGHGIGGIFSRIASFVKPLLRSAVTAAKPIAKQTLKKLGKTGLQVAASTLGDVVEGGIPLKQAVKQNVKRGVKRGKSTIKAGAKKALKRSVSSVQKDINSKSQTGKGKSKKKRGRKKKNIGIFKKD